MFQKYEFVEVKQLQKRCTDLPLIMIKTEQLKKTLRVVFKTGCAKVEREEDLT